MCVRQFCTTVRRIESVLVAALAAVIGTALAEEGPFVSPILWGYIYNGGHSESKSILTARSSLRLFCAANNRLHG